MGGGGWWRWIGRGGWVEGMGGGGLGWRIAVRPVNSAEHRHSTDGAERYEWSAGQQFRSKYQRNQFLGRNVKAPGRMAC